MSRYRKVETAMWSDARFQRLSRAQPNGQTLWMYLLFGPRTQHFPGLIVGREAVMADDLGWSLEGFREAFGEASRQAMAKADWSAGLVVLPKALLDSTGGARPTSRPESPNVLRKWAKSWSEIPECRLKDEYLEMLGAFAEACGEGFAKAFMEGFAKALSKGSREAYPNPSPHPSPHPSSNQDPVFSEQETGDRRYIPPRSGTVPLNARGGSSDWLEQRRALGERIWSDLQALRDRLAAEHQLEVRPLPPFDRGKTELAARLLESGPDRAEADARHVLAVLEAEANATGSIEWVAGGAFTATSWARKLAMTVEDARRARGHRQAQAGESIGPAAPRHDHPEGTLVPFGDA